MVKISELITELTTMWINWVKCDKIARCSDYSYKERRIAAEKCEELIAKRYEIISKINTYFE
jgi:hypothetical protein